MARHNVVPYTTGGRNSIPTWRIAVAAGAASGGSTTLLEGEVIKQGAHTTAVGTAVLIADADFVIGTTRNALGVVATD